MASVRLYYNPDCTSCVKRAGLMKRLDWVGHVEVHTEPPPAGPLPLGAIAVQTLGDGRWFEGASAMQQLWFRVPLLWPLALLLYIPPLKRMMEPAATTCHGETCAVPTTTSQAPSPASDRPAS